jgi:hypothetical protein
MENRSDFLLSMAVGNAYGMKHEFVEHDIPVPEDDLFFAPHPSFTEYRKGHWKWIGSFSPGFHLPIVMRDTKDNHY